MRESVCVCICKCMCVCVCVCGVCVCVCVREREREMLFILFGGLVCGRHFIANNILKMMLNIEKFGAEIVRG